MSGASGVDAPTASPPQIFFPAGKLRSSTPPLQRCAEQGLAHLVFGFKHPIAGVLTISSQAIIKCRSIPEVSIT